MLIGNNNKNHTRVWINMKIMKFQLESLSSYLIYFSEYVEKIHYAGR